MVNKNIGINKIHLSPADFRSREKKPLYVRLQERIQHLIEDGDWKPNERIPTERELVNITGISINTIKKALQSLEQDGYLQRRQGAGTFVTSPETFFGMHRFYGMLSDFGESMARHRKEVLSLDNMAVPEPIRRYLELESGERVFRLERLLYVSGIKTIHTFSWLPEKMFLGLNKLDKEEFVTIPLYELLAVRFNMPCRLSQELLSVRTAEPDIAAKLEIPTGIPLLCTNIIAFSYRNKPFEFRENRILTGDRKLYREF